MEVAVAYHWMNSHLVRSACSRSTGGRSPLPCNILYRAFRVQGILAATQSTGREDTREVGDTGKVGIAMTAIYPRQVVGGTCCKVLAPALQIFVKRKPILSHAIWLRVNTRLNVTVRRWRDVRVMNRTGRSSVVVVFLVQVFLSKTQVEFFLLKVYICFFPLARLFQHLLRQR